MPPKTSVAKATPSDAPTIETSAEPAPIDLVDIEGESLERVSDGDDFAAVREAELFSADTRAEDTRAEDTPAEDTPAEGASTERVPEASAEMPALPVDQTPHPSEGDIPDFRPRRRGRAAFAAVVGCAVVVVASVGWSRFASDGERAAANVPAPTAERAPARANPEPAPPPVAAVATASTTQAPALEGVVDESPEKSPATVTVTIKTVPEEAVIFRAGKRLGTGVVEVSVERNVKQRLTALHDGYTPSNIVLDGTRDSVTVRLKRAPKPRPAPVPESDSPYGDAPSADATAATAPATTTAPAATATPGSTASPTTGSTAQPAPTPEAPSSESPY